MDQLLSEEAHEISLCFVLLQVISYNKYTGPYAADDGGSNWKLFSQEGETCKWQHSHYNGKTVTQ